MKISAAVGRAFLISLLIQTPFVIYFIRIDRPHYFLGGATYLFYTYAVSLMEWVVPSWKHEPNYGYFRLVIFQCLLLTPIISVPLLLKQWIGRGPRS
jgi:hypothetical protein